MRPPFLLFDIGGTKMRIAVSADGKTFEEPRIVPTPETVEEGVRVLCSIAEDLLAGRRAGAVAGGTPGTLDTAKTMITNAPNLPGWNGKPFTAPLQQRVGCPVFLENDTAMAGLGEAHAGAGKGFRIVAYLTISTGVGGDRIVDGAIDASAMGVEPGHQLIDADGTLRPELGGVTSLEEYISGTAFSRRFGKPAKEITDDAVWDEAARWLAVGLHNTILHWSPDVVVLGGSMMNVPGIPIAGVRAHLRELMRIFPKLPDVRPAALGDLGGLHGALVFLS